MSLIHQATALLVSFIWGTNFVFIRYALDEIQSFPLATLRFLLVAFPLIFFLPKPEVPWRLLIAYGLLIGVGQFGLLYSAMQSDITPGMASLVVQVQVFFTVGLSYLVLKEAASGRQISAMLIGLLGLFVIFYNSDEQTTLLGVMVTMIAALAWAGGNLVVKMAGKVDAFAFIIWSSLFAVPPLFAISLVYQDIDDIMRGVLSLSMVGWGAVIWQSVGNMIIGYGLWNMLLHRYPAAAVTPWALLIPVFGMAASWWVLDEVMPWWKLVAMGLIVAGLAINAWESRARSSH